MILLLTMAKMFFVDFALVVFLDMSEVGWPISESYGASRFIAYVRLSALMLELMLDAVYFLWEAFGAVLASKILDAQMDGIIVPLQAEANLIVLLASLEWAVVSAILTLLSLDSYSLALFTHLIIDTWN